MEAISSGTLSAGREHVAHKRTTGVRKKKHLEHMVNFGLESCYRCPSDVPKDIFTREGTSERVQIYIQYQVLYVWESVATASQSPPQSKFSIVLLAAMDPQGPQEYIPVGTSEVGSAWK